MNPTLTIRNQKCWVCKRVAATEDVTARMFTEEGTRLPFREAIDYLRSIGIEGTDKTMRARLARHVAHIVADLREQRAIAPAHVEQGQVVRIAPERPQWLRASQNAMEVGQDALRILRERLEDMEDSDLIAVSRIGVGAAHKLGDLEAKGRSLAQVDGLMQLAAGLGLPSAGD